MKQKKNGGFTLVETMIAIVILAIIVVPTGSSIVLSYKMNARAEQLLEAQLNLSAAVEHFKTYGYDKVGECETKYGVVVTPKTGTDYILISYEDVQICCEKDGEIVNTGGGDTE